MSTVTNLWLPYPSPLLCTFCIIIKILFNQNFLWFINFSAMQLDITFRQGASFYKLTLPWLFRIMVFTKEVSVFWLEGLKFGAKAESHNN